MQLLHTSPTNKSQAAKDAALEASTVIAQAGADPTFAKLTANAVDQEQISKFVMPQALTVQLKATR